MRKSWAFGRLVATLGLALGLTSCAMVQGVNETRSTRPQSTSTAEPPQASTDTSTPTATPETVYDKASANAGTPSTFNRDEILSAGKNFFGSTSEEFARLIERVFAQYGEPTAYIEGEEGSAAFVAGLRYGQGHVQIKGGSRSPVFWQGPSVGFDFGGNAAKVFTLVYNLDTLAKLYQRYPGVEGSVYVLAGFGLNYQKSGDVVLAPIRTGVGLRAGASVGYLHYTAEPSYLPF